MMDLLVTLLVWYAYVAAAACTAIIVCGALIGRRERTARRHIPVPPHGTERPRVVHVTRAEGSVIALRPNRETVIHGDGSEWR